MSKIIDVETVTLPAHWASALINGDYSGLDETNTELCRKAESELAATGRRVVSTVEGSVRFTWHYAMYSGDTFEGGEVMDYVVHVMGGAS